MPARFVQAHFSLVEINNAKLTTPAGMSVGSFSRTAAGNRAYSVSRSPHQPSMKWHSLRVFISVVIFFFSSISKIYIRNCVVIVVGFLIIGRLCVRRGLEPWNFRKDSANCSANAFWKFLVSRPRTTTNGRQQISEERARTTDLLIHGRHTTTRR